MKPKSILTGLVAFLSALAYGLFQKARRETEKRELAETSLKTSREANEHHENIRRLSDADLNKRLRKYQKH